MSASHTLVVIRHAQAEGHAASDFERPLSRRGRADARAAGDWLAREQVQAAGALVSSALRTRETWDALASAAGWTISADFSERLYGADEYDVLDSIAVTDESLGTLVVVGHNPTMHGLAVTLGGADPASADRLATGFPTASVAVFDVDVAWAALGHGPARLRALETARAD